MLLFSPLSEQEMILLLSSLSDDFLFLLFVFYTCWNLLLLFSRLYIQHLLKIYLLNLYQLLVWEKSKDFQYINKMAGYKNYFSKYQKNPSRKVNLFFSSANSGNDFWGPLEQTFYMPSPSRRILYSKDEIAEYDLFENRHVKIRNNDNKIAKCILCSWEHKRFSWFSWFTSNQ